MRVTLDHVLRFHRDIKYIVDFHSRKFVKSINDKLLQIEGESLTTRWCYQYYPLIPAGIFISGVSLRNSYTNYDTLDIDYISMGPSIEECSVMALGIKEWGPNRHETGSGGTLIFKEWKILHRNGFLPTFTATYEYMREGYLDLKRFKREKEACFLPDGNLRLEWEDCLLYRTVVRCSPVD